MAEKKTPLNTKQSPVERRAIQNGLIEARPEAEDPFGYAGPGIYPSAEGDALMGRVAEARARAIYEAHGRNANAIARMKLDPSYAIATAAGIQLPGHGMVNTYNTQTGGLVGNAGAGQRPAGSGGANPAADRALRNSISYRDAGAAMRGAGDAKPISYTEFAGPAAANETSKGQRMDTVRDTRNLPGGMRAPAQGPEQQPIGSKPPAPMTDPTSATPPQTPSQGQPQEQKTPTVESTKGPRLSTNRSQPSRDEDMGTTRGATRDEDRRVSEISMSADANLPYDGREGPGSNQERREIAKKEYDAKVQSEARKDPFAKYRTEAGDTEIAQRTGEVQDRSRFGEDRVAGRQTYKNKDGKEMIGNTMQRPDGSTYFVGLPSADQNKADAFNAGTKGGTLNPYNNFEPTPKNYKASADDIRANYAFGAPAGQQGPLMAEAEPDFGRGNRSQLDADTAKFSAGSNYSGIDSRGKQSSSLAGGPAEKPQSQAFSISSPGLPFQQEPKETSQAYKGPEGSQNNNQAQAELKEKSKNLSKKGGERLTFA